MKQIVKTAVFPVAGLGTRFLPVTKTGPKELLPIIDKPIIQYAVEEAVAAGCNKLIFITSHAKRAIEDYFDRNLQLEYALETQGKHSQLRTLRELVPDDVDIVYIRQKFPNGLGDAVLCARTVVGDEPFVVSLPDDLLSDHNVLKTMIEHYQQYKQSVVAVEKIDPQDSDKYGVAALDEGMCIRKIIEKPKPEDAPSNLGVIGRYVFSPTIFSHLAKLGRGAGNEVQLTDAIATLLDTQGVRAYPITGKRYDCGYPAGYVKAVIDISLQREDLTKEINNYMQEQIKD